MNAQPSPFRSSILFAGTAAILLCAGFARADVLVVSLSPPGSVSAGSAGNGFDVLLTNTSGPAVDIGVFTFELAVSSPDVTFTDATTASVASPYIFAGNSLIGPDIVGSNTGQDLTAFDLYGVTGANITLGSGATVSLGHVLFDVSSGAPSETVDLSFVAAGTSLSLANCCAGIPIDALNGGQLVITGAVSAVPEPSALSLLAIMVAVIGAGSYRGRPAMRKEWSSSTISRPNAAGSPCSCVRHR